MNMGNPIFLQNNNQIDNQYELQRLRQMLDYTIRNKMTSLEIYNKLINGSPDQFSSNLLEILRMNEEQSLYNLNTFYISTYGTTPDIVITPQETFYTTYQDGLLLALRLKSDGIVLDRTFISMLGENEPGKPLYEQVHAIDLEQENIIRTLIEHYEIYSR